MNEPTFLLAGTRGKTAPPRGLAPIGPTVPWKYGCKSVKSMIEAQFAGQRLPGNGDGTLVAPPYADETKERLFA
jgi:DMSO/TMAO reductase YedYZ molybdopterin-dependent catalytic subunit